MMKKLFAPLFFATLLPADSLETLLEKLQNQNLQLQESREHILIAKEQTDLVQSWENPRLGIGANDLLLDDLAARDREPMQTHFVTLSQKIPTGGKIALRREVATLQTQEARLRYMTQMRKLRSMLLRYAFKTAIVERKIDSIENYRQNIIKLRHLHRKRFSVGMGSQRLIEESSISLERLSIKKAKLITQKANLLDQIAQLLYEDISSVEVDLDINRHIETDIENHPQLQMANVKLQQAKERLRLARAKQIPDVTLGVGYYQRNGRSDYLSVHANIPLPVRGREEKEIKVAQLQISQKQKQHKALRFTLTKKAEQLHRTLLDARKSYKEIREKIIPKKHYIQKLIGQEIFTKNTSSTDLIQNLNETVRLELDAYDELARYFDAYARLDYFSGAKQ